MCGLGGGGVLRRQRMGGYMSAASCDRVVAPFEAAALGDVDVAVEEQFKAHLSLMHRHGPTKWIDLSLDLITALLKTVAGLEHSNSIATGANVPLPLAELIGNPPQQSNVMTPSPTGLWWSERESGEPPGWLNAVNQHKIGKKNSKYISEVFLFVARKVWSAHLRLLPKEVSLAVTKEARHPWSANPVLHHILNEKSRIGQRSAVSWTELILTANRSSKEPNDELNGMDLAASIQLLRAKANGRKEPDKSSSALELASRVLTALLDQNSGCMLRSIGPKTLSLLLTQTGERFFAGAFDGRSPVQLEPRVVGILYRLARDGRACRVHFPTITRLKSAMPLLKKMFTASKKGDSECRRRAQGRYESNEADAVLNAGYSLVVDVVPGIKIPD